MAKIDTAAGLVNAFGIQEVQIPACATIREQDKPFLAEILPARAREEWDGPSLITAVQYARCMADTEAAQKELDLTGFTQTNEKGTLIANPLCAVVESLTRRGMALQRNLQIDPTKKVGQARDVKGKREIDKKIRATKASADDSLIPGIHH